MPTESAFPSGVLQRASVTLTSAQLLAIFTTPVQLVPAPGAGMAIVPVNIAYNYTAGTTAYTDGGGALQVFPQSHGTGSTWFNLTTNGFWTASVSRFFASSAGNVSSNLSVYTNLPLMIGQSVANPTLGNGTLTVTVLYYVVPVS